VPSGSLMCCRAISTFGRGPGQTIGQAVQSRSGHVAPSRRFGRLALLVAWFLCMSEAEQVRRNRLRRAAQRQDLLLARSPRHLLLARSPRRDPRAGDFGPYLPVDMATSTLVPADHETGYQLNNSQGYINGDLS
jgi:hypothetical protein